MQPLPGDAKNKVHRLMRAELGSPGTSCPGTLNSRTTRSCQDHPTRSQPRPVKSQRDPDQVDRGDVPERHRRADRRARARVAVAHHRRAGVARRVQAAGMAEPSSRSTRARSSVRRPPLVRGRRKLLGGVERRVPSSSLRAFVAGGAHIRLPRCTHAAPRLAR